MSKTKKPEVDYFEAADRLVAEPKRELRSVKILALSQALSPLTHNRGTEGNETVIQTEAVWTKKGKRSVPALSGNAIRHRMVRAPGSYHLVDAYELTGKLSQKILQFMFHGGALEGGSTTENTNYLMEFWRLFPFFRLLGGSLTNSILPGSLMVGRGMLICEENRKRIELTIPGDWGISDRALFPARRYIERFEYYRYCADKHQRELARKDDPDSFSPMPFAGQAVAIGAHFLHTFQMSNASDLEIGALLHALRCWRKDNGTLGGSSARGHGVIGMQIHHDLDEDALVQAYVEHVSSVRREAVAWLLEHFGGIQ